MPTSDRPDTLAQRNEWLEGVQARAEFEGGYYRLPASDWEGVLDCFAFGERLLEQRTQERDEARELEAALRRIEDFPAPPVQNVYGAYHEMQKIAREALKENAPE